MAFTTVGFDGSVTEAEWSKLLMFAGAPYAVSGKDDWTPSIVPAVDRTIKVLTGVGYGHGVKVTNTADATVQLDSVVSGTRWDLISVYLDWTANTAALRKVNGTSTQTLPSGRAVTPGTGFDIPVALAQVTAGQQLPTALIDLRLWASKVLTGNSLLVLTDAPLGTEAVILNQRYRRTLVAGNVETTAVEPQTASGVYGAVMSGSTNVTSFTVTLPAGRFRTAPEAIPSLKTSSGASNDLNVRVLTTTTSNFTLAVYSSSGANVAAGTYPVAWVAVA